MLLGYFGFPRSMVSSYRILDILETHWVSGDAKENLDILKDLAKSTYV